MHCISENTQEFQIIQKVLLANKIDLSPETHRISREEGLELAERHRIDFFEVSAKEGRGIDAAFLRLAELVVKAQQTGDQVSWIAPFHKIFLKLLLLSITVKSIRCEGDN
jgi:50S ribosomal subunit-associated GTPase HflX